MRTVCDQGLTTIALGALLAVLGAVSAQGKPALDRVLSRWIHAYEAGKIGFGDLAIVRGRVDSVYGRGWLGRRTVDMSHRVALQLLLDHTAKQPSPVVTRLVLRLASKGLLDGSATIGRPHYAVRKLGRLALYRHTSTASMLFLMQVAAGDFKGFARPPKYRLGLQVAAMQALGGIGRAVVRPTLQRQLAAGESVVRLAAAEALGEIGHPRALGDLLAALGRETESVAALAMVAAIRETLRRALGHLGTRALRAALRAVIGALGRTDWRTDLEIVRLLGEVRNVMAVEPLIRILERFARPDAGKRQTAKPAAGDRVGSSRLRYQAFECLRSLTGALLPIDRPDLWWEFWRRVGATFVIAPQKELTATQTAARFFGMSVRGSNVLFLIDTSGSMSTAFYPAGDYEPTAEDDGLTRLRMAQRELARTIAGLAGDTRVNLIEFSTGVRRWRAAGALATTNARAVLLARVRQLRPGGATNVFAALAAGLAIENLAYGSRYGTSIDEVFLLSDGEPTAGRVIATDDILQLVLATNRFSKVRINTLYMGGGGDSEFMRQLAAQNGGQYVRL